MEKGVPELQRVQKDPGRLVAFVIAIFAVILSAWPSFPLQFTMGQDWAFELARVEQYRAAVEGLQFPPAWAPGDYGGWGGPLFIFYPHGFAGVGALFTWMLGDPLAGSVLALWCFTAFGAAAMAFAVRAAGGSWLAAGVGAAAYVLHPYLLSDRYLRNANAEYAALCALPLAMGGVFLADRRRTLSALAVAAGLAIAVVSHAMVGLMAMGIVVVAAVVVHGPSSWVSHWRVAAGAALGLAMSSFYWLPAIVLKQHVNIEARSASVQRVAENFATPAELLGQATFFGLGAAGVALAVLSLLSVSARSPLGRRAALGAAALTVLGVVMALEPSRVVWANAPVLPYFGFPWRFLGVTAVGTALGLGLAVDVATRSGHGRRRAFVAIGAVALVVVAALPKFSQTRQFPAEVASQARVDMQHVQMRELLIRASADNQSVPTSADMEFWVERPGTEGAVIGASGDGNAVAFSEAPLEFSLMVDSRNGTRVHMARWAFPGWIAATEDGRVPVGVGEHGEVVVDVPAGFHELWIEYRPPMIRRVTTGISAVSAVLWLLILELALRRRARARLATDG